MASAKTMGASLRPSASGLLPLAKVDERCKSSDLRRIPAGCIAHQVLRSSLLSTISRDVGGSRDESEALAKHKKNRRYFWMGVVSEGTHCGFAHVVATSPWTGAASEDLHRDPWTGRGE
jgi:hypothetical protein